jgi:hypothetical protein
MPSLTPDISTMPDEKRLTTGGDAATAGAEGAEDGGAGDGCTGDGGGGIAAAVVGGGAECAGTV